MRLALLLVLLPLPATVGCAAVGTRPHEMSAPEHELAALAAEAEAERVSGSLPRGMRELACANAPCASAAVRRTEDSRYLLYVATQHRAAARKLREAEQSACIGIAEGERHVSPLASLSILATSRYEERQGRYGKRLKGAVVEIDTVPGMTAVQLQRAIACHVAHVAVAPRPHADRCPFAVGGASAEVERKAGHLAVRIAADDRKAAQEIWARAGALAENDAAKYEPKGTK